MGLCSLPPARQREGGHPFGTVAGMEGDHLGVCRSIYALLPLWDDRRKTEEYFNRYLFADARLHGGSDGTLWEGEVNPALAPAVRLEILKVISADDSFEQARDIITRSDHRYHQPDDYNSILHDPPAPSHYIEQDW